MIQGDNHGCRYEHFPIAVEGKKRQGAEDMKMSFDPPSGNVDEESGEEHLGDGNNVAGQGPSRAEHCPKRRGTDHPPPPEHRRPHTPMEPTRRPPPPTPPTSPRAY